MESPLDSFFRFVAGFFTFISVSFGVTYLAQKGVIAKMQADQLSAAAKAALESDR